MPNKIIQNNTFFFAIKCIPNGLLKRNHKNAVNQKCMKMAVLFLRGTFFWNTFHFTRCRRKGILKRRGLLLLDLHSINIALKKLSKTSKLERRLLTLPEQGHTNCLQKIAFHTFFEKAVFFLHCRPFINTSPLLNTIFNLAPFFSSMAQSAESGLLTSKNYQKRIISTNRPLEFLLQKKDQIHPFSVETTPDIVLVVA